MIVSLSFDDLVYDFKGNKRKPKLGDFPVLEGVTFGPMDVVIYKYQNKEDEVTIILRGPCVSAFDVASKILMEGVKND